MAATTTARPASEKQMSWVDKMIEQKGITAEEMYARTGFAYADLTTKTAGVWLDILFAAPKAKTGDEPTEEGFYLLPGDVVVKLVWNKAGTNMYGKQLERGQGFQYVAGCANGAKASMLLDAEGARLYGIRTGVCVACGLDLDAGVSLSIGLGPTCGPRVMGKNEYRAAVRAWKVSQGMPVRGVRSVKEAEQEESFADVAAATERPPVAKRRMPSRDETPMAHNGREFGPPAGFAGSVQADQDAKVEDLLAYFK